MGTKKPGANVKRIDEIVTPLLILETYVLRVILRTRQSLCVGFLDNDIRTDVGE